METDPFLIEGNFTAPRIGHRIPFDKITPHDHAIIRAMGERATKLVTDVQTRAKHPELVRVPPPTWAAAEIACAHLCRDLDLTAMHQSDDLAFMSDYVAIVRTINRSTGNVPSEIRLRFARK